MNAKSTKRRGHIISAGPRDLAARSESASCGIIWGLLISDTHKKKNTHTQVSLPSIISCYKSAQQNFIISQSIAPRARQQLLHLDPRSEVPGVVPPPLAHDADLRQEDAIHRPVVGEAGLAADVAQLAQAVAVPEDAVAPASSSVMRLC
jgi:hypothetical protein